MNFCPSIKSTATVKKSKPQERNWDAIQFRATILLLILMLKRCEALGMLLESQQVWMKHLGVLKIGMGETFCFAQCTKREKLSFFLAGRQANDVTSGSKRRSAHQDYTPTRKGECE